VHKLSCHTDPGDLPIERVEADLTVARGTAAGGARLDVHFRIVADTGQLCLPALRQGRRTDGLWRHSCFELFVRAPGAAAYAEVNLAPSGDWAAYRFSAYRDGLQPIVPMTAPAIDAVAAADMFELRASLRLDELRPGARQPGTTLLEVALAAVIEECSGRLSYWAANHPDPKRPDFHHPGSFVHEVRY